jgi:hypothetical protein
MANELPLTMSPASLLRFMSHIQSSGVPSKVDRAYLRSVGFKSGNDSYIVPVLKRIGFVSSSGIPETKWRSYRDKMRAPKILAAAILEGYSDLFEVYPDAFRKDEEALRNWVRSKTEYDEVKVGYAVKTFQALVSQANFEHVDMEDAAQSSVVPDVSVPVFAAEAAGAGAPQGARSPLSAPAFNINIELHLPASADSDTYEKFFAAMKKHLFPDASV